MVSDRAVSVVCSDLSQYDLAQHTADQLGVPIVSESSPATEYRLCFTPEGVLLEAGKEKKHGGVMVDFCAGSVAHRRRFGGGKGQLIAKAVGLQGPIKPTVLDVTAGLGKDAFVLATLGCQVLLMERNPVVYALLADGLARARRSAAQGDAELGEILARMTLHSGDGIDYLLDAVTPKVDVIYLDPMFPERTKSAAVKKEMQAFHAVVGGDEDGGRLLDAAFDKAIFRVVVKRPRLAPSIGDSKPSFVVTGKSSRFDVYAFKKLSPAPPSVP